MSSTPSTFVKYTMPTSASTKAQLNAANLQMRQQPWYQQWFTQQGLNPNNVQLSDDQRRQLAAVAAQHGMPLSSDMNVDPAGNLNTNHGFASLPTWAKIAIGAAPIAGAALLTGGSSLIPTFGAGGGGGAATGAAATNLTAGMSSLVPSIATSVVPSAAAAGLGTTGTALLGLGTNALTSLYGIHAQSSAAKSAAQLEADAANRAATLQSDASAASLKFLQDQEATRKAEFDKTQALNLAQYNTRDARLAPYRDLGADAATNLRNYMVPGSGVNYLPPPTQYTTGRQLIGAA